MDAYVIYCNDSIVNVVLADEEKAKKHKDEMREEHYKRNLSYFNNCNFQEYNEQVHWGYRKVNVLNENSALITEKKDYINMLCGICKVDDKFMMDLLLSDGFVRRVYGNENINIEWNRSELEKEDLINCEEIFSIYWELR